MRNTQGQLGKGDCRGWPAIRKLFLDGVALLTEINLDLPRGLLLDKILLRQVLLNVVGNEIKFTEKGQVVIRAKCRAVAPESDLAGGSWVSPGSPRPKVEGDLATDSSVTLILEVEDTGIGIPKDQLEHIFGAFAQVSGQSTRKFGGTGLGLAITRRLTEMMRGIISVRSEPGQGSVFQITFPIVAVTELPETAAAAADVEAGRLRHDWLSLKSQPAEAGTTCHAENIETHHVVEENQRIGFAHPGWVWFAVCVTGVSSCSSLGRFVRDCACVFCWPYLGGV